ncbi:transposase [Streptomyces sp. SID4928]|nr:transposase [Streptomyces sp. SID4928]
MAASGSGPSAQLPASTIARHTAARRQRPPGGRPPDTTPSPARRPARGANPDKRPHPAPRPRLGPGRPRVRPDHVLGDKGYSSKAIRAWLRRRGIGHTIPERADQARNRYRRGSRGGRRPAFDKQVYKRRNVLERCFNRLKQWRGLATRFDKTAQSYEAAVTLASLLMWV